MEIVEMNRNICDAMGKIFQRLSEGVQGEDYERIVNVRRHINPGGDAEPVKDFVAHATIKEIHCASEFICVFSYKEQRYLLLDKRFAETLSEIGLQYECDGAIVQAAGMLAISTGVLPLAKELSSLQIIERCLGVLPEEGNDVTFDFAALADMFLPYCVIQLIDGCFELLYTEDYSRLICYLLVEESNFFDGEAKTRIKDLILLPSSRSIATSLLNGLRSPLMEYTFLQIYQCIEYLFKLNNCFIINEKHGVALETSIDIVLEHELKITESENLYQVLKSGASESALHGFVALLQQNQPGEDEYRRTANYIYKLRCNVAHLRYKQDDLSEVDWKRFSIALIDILYSIYQKQDRAICYVCSQKGSWNLLSE